MYGEENQLLASLCAMDAGSTLIHHFKTVDIAQEQVLAEPLEQMHHVYFPYSGIVSFLVPLSDGHVVQTGMVGRDGAVGGLQALDGKVASNKIVVRVPGRAVTIEADRVGEMAQASSGIRSLFLSHEQFFLAEVQQSAACNAVHTIEQRICRWMLRMSDLIGMNVAVTQELLSQMIGVRRSSVSLAAGSLQQAGLIRYRRGHIQIVDIERLKQSSCECYKAVRDHYDRFVNVVAASSGSGAS
jgi:CRP-like cAMP-binding protein